MQKKALFSAEEIADLTEGVIVGNPETLVFGLNRIEEVKSGELTFYSDKSFEKYLYNIEAACLLAPKDFSIKLPDNVVIIKVEKPYNSMVKLLKFLDSQIANPADFIHPTAIIDETSKIDESAFIGPYCVIGKNCIISKNVVLHSNITLYDNVSISDNTFIHSGVVCYSNSIIGKKCLIHAGAVIGSDGFGFIENKDGSYDKIPQMGNVIIEDEVEIGANTTIDRAIIGSTIIGTGVKIDNLCQIAHNVKVGENTAMAAQVGIAGSCSVGKRNRLGGQSGLAGHLETADDVIVYAQSGVAKTIEKKGIYFGSPSKERLHAFKIEAVLNNLPELAKEIEQIRKKLEG